MKIYFINLVCIYKGIIALQHIYGVLSSEYA